VRVAPHLQPVVGRLGETVSEAGAMVEHAYFPEGAVLSLLTVLENGTAIETAVIGREGAYGIFAAMYSPNSFNRCVVQLDGAMTRVPMDLLRSEFKRSERVRDLFIGYYQTLLAQIQQSVACNAMHTTEQRLCRWLLTMHDHGQGDILPYTQEFMASILDANRKSVTIAAQQLQSAGLVAYRRGKIRLEDRKGLEHAACECYGIVKSWSEEVFAQLDGATVTHKAR